MARKSRSTVPRAAGIRALGLQLAGAERPDCRLRWDEDG